jgi:DNA-binding beta-propeller fold protein YncE
MLRSAMLTISAFTAAFICAGPVRAADIILSMNDNHTVLDEKGAQVAATPMRPDTVDLIDIGQSPPRIVGTVDVPGSVVGPPFAVWMAADSSWAILTAATKADPAVPLGIAWDDTVSVLDLTSTPPHVTQVLHAGAGATSVRLSPDGTLALVCNRAEGSVSVFTVKDKHLEPAGKVMFGDQSGASGVAFSPDGKTAIVSRPWDDRVSVLHIDGKAVTVDKQPITTAIQPYTIDVVPDRSLAAISNMGRGSGDGDSVSLVDMTANPPRAISIAPTASGPEPMKFSPDGKFLAVGAEMGTPLAQSNPLYHDHGLLQIFALTNKTLSLVATGQIGRWTEGIAWSRDGKTLLVQSDRDRIISVFDFDGHTLTAKPDLVPTGGPVAFGVPWP